MPLITYSGGLPEITDVACPLLSRFTFERTQGPSLGLKDAGVYFTLASNQTVAADAGTFGLGLGGFMDQAPARDFGLVWKGLPRSTPVPLLLGTTRQYSLQLTNMFYIGRNLHEIEDFLRGIPNAIGPYAGKLRHYQQNGTIVYKTYTNTYFRNLAFTYNGDKSFVEYSLLFEGAEEPT